MSAGAPRTTAVIRPAAGWYVLPSALVVVAVLELLVFVILNISDIRIGDDPEGTGSAAGGARIYLVKDHDYFVYVENSGNTPTVCGVAGTDGAGSVALTRSNSWAASTTESVDGRSYSYSRTFTSPTTGTATVTCQGLEGGIMVKPDDTALLYFGIAIMVAFGLSVLALVAFLIIILRRSAAKRAALAASRPFKGPYG